ncbi:MAG: HTH-type transcriptional regulator MalT [Deltaproteobacteria bacterium]|nr:HTH-type transcriptional regulator MalT [Deltaproteobacteria bacterium]MBW2051619.1 HTH-type transcriptional regulator MalT [Deltaproteobacteria bacterium]MBW2140753.1 HTH-type transcriptional regulator MalT [Deltaproteobacteria bacterium]MBW2322703.1 HTH-type transcriptional regulator MalT [Deltaproteobacteria bacterium]
MSSSASKTGLVEGFAEWEPLLATKLFIPQARPDLIKRPRLIERLNKGLKRKLAIISATAGFGKTTLLSSWYNASLSSKIPVAWLSLDGDDNDPTRFWAYLIRSVGAIKQGVDEKALALLVSPNPPPIESVITALINELTVIPEDFVLILDDYHVIKAKPIHEAITFMIEHQPPQMHLVISGRSEPPLSLARLRGSGQLIELGAADLRFTQEEASSFLRQLMGLKLSPQQVAALENRTEGWIAGLQMAALSMQGHEDISDYIETFAGDDRSIMDYLIEEILEKQPENIQTFVLETSILDRVTAPLCNAVTGRKDGQEMLEKLERANLFITSLDNKRRWYRYHRLFADALRQRLDQLKPERIPELHHLASIWYEKNNLPDEALAHALSAGDYERLAQLLEQAGWPMLMHGEVNLMLECLEALPDEMIRSRPRLSLYHAWALLRNIKFEEVESRLGDAEQGFGLNKTQEDPPDTSKPLVREMLGILAALRVCLAVNEGDVPRTLELARQALEYLPQDNLVLRGVVTRNLGDAYESEDDLVAAVKAQTEAIAISQAGGDTFEAVLATSRLGRLHEIQGHLHLAAKSYREALQIAAKKRDGPPAPISALAHMGLGDVLREWNDLDNALPQIYRAIALYKRWGSPVLMPEGYANLARVKYAQGEMSGALTAIEEAKKIAEENNYTQTIDRISGIQARLWVKMGNLEAASAWMLESGLKPQDNFSHLPFRTIQVTYLTLARVLLARNETDQVLELIEKLRQIAAVSGRMGGLIEVLVCEALTLQKTNEMEKATKTIQQALFLGETENFMRVFLTEGPPMTSLLNSVLENRHEEIRGIRYDVSDDYIKKLLLALEIFSQRPQLNIDPNQSLVEPLSDREFEVLKLLAAGLSNKEIGEKLFVAINTVKTHIRNIYGKLNVRSRTQAIAQAKKINLLH